jgi:UDP-N-acetylmuramate dehydrogenase
MTVVKEHVLLAPHTTLGVGGAARFFADCTSEAELHKALAYAREHTLPIAILGGGSNTLVPDAEFEGLVIKVSVRGLAFEEDGGSVIAVAGAGVSWDELVVAATGRGLWGIENLAAIPGTVGGAVVQNIGAYGAELSQTFVWAEAVTLAGGTARTLRADAEFAYRTSIFKKCRDLLITRVALRLSRSGVPQLSYPDLVKAAERNEPLSTPQEIADVVRRIRSAKFPHNESTAGSFFKNPIVSSAVGEKLKAQFPGLPLNSVGDGRVKVPLAWILDQALGLKGFAVGSARLFERQPLVLVVQKGGTARDVDALADMVRERVKEATSLTIEREVETMRAR